MVWDGGLGMLLKAISFAVKWFKNVKNAPKLIKDLLSQLQVVEDELTRDDIAINQDDVVKQALRHPDAKLKMSLALAERTFKQVDERLEAIFVLMNLKSYKKVWGFIDARIIPGLDPQLVMSKQKELSEMMLALVRASDAYGRHIGLITAYCNRKGLEKAMEDAVRKVAGLRESDDADGRSRAQATAEAAREYLPGFLTFHSPERQQLVAHTLAERKQQLQSLRAVRPSERSEKDDADMVSLAFLCGTAEELLAFENAIINGYNDRLDWPQIWSRANAAIQRHAPDATNSARAIQHVFARGDKVIQVEWRDTPDASGTLRQVRLTGQSASDSTSRVVHEYQGHLPIRSSRQSIAAGPSNRASENASDGGDLRMWSLDRNRPNLSSYQESFAALDLDLSALESRQYRQYGPEWEMGKIVDDMFKAVDAARRSEMGALQDMAMEVDKMLADFDQHRRRR